MTNIKGILFSFIIAIPAYLLGIHFPIIGGPVFGILLGMVLNGIRRPDSFEKGISFTAKKILQYSIILLGFDMNLFHVLDIGAKSFSVMIFTILTSFAVAIAVGRLLHLKFKTTTLIGAGTAICGGSAIAAVAPVIDATEKDVAFSISTIFLFNVIAVFLFPFLGHLMSMTDAAFGMWAGTAINDTSSVVAAGYSYSEAAGGLATITKLTRALMIVPVCLMMAVIVARRNRQSDKDNTFSIQRIFPFFIAWFVVASVVNTTGVLPVELTHFLSQAGKFLIIMAMTAIGLHTNLLALLRNGLRPIALGLACWFSVATVSLIIQHINGMI